MYKMASIYSSWRKQTEFLAAYHQKKWCLMVLLIEVLQFHSILVINKELMPRNIHILMSLVKLSLERFQRSRCPIGKTVVKLMFVSDHHLLKNQSKLIDYQDPSHFPTKIKSEANLNAIMKEISAEKILSSLRLFSGFIL